MVIRGIFFWHFFSSTCFTSTANLQDDQTEESATRESTRPRNFPSKVSRILDDSWAFLIRLLQKIITTLWRLVRCRACQHLSAPLSSVGSEAPYNPSYAKLKTLRRMWSMPDLCRTCVGHAYLFMLFKSENLCPQRLAQNTVECY